MPHAGGFFCSLTPAVFLQPHAGGFFAASRRRFFCSLTPAVFLQPHAGGLVALGFQFAGFVMAPEGWTPGKQDRPPTKLIDRVTPKPDFVCVILWNPRETLPVQIEVPGLTKYERRCGGTLLGWVVFLIVASLFYVRRGNPGL